MHDDINRWCNNYAVNANYPAGTNCVVARGTKDDILGLQYRLKASDDLSLSARYSFDKKKTDFDTNAITADEGAEWRRYYQHHHRPECR